MTKTFTASVLALSLAFSGLSVAPAVAGKNDDLGRFIVGAAAIALIAKAVEDNKRRRNQAARVTTPPPAAKPPHFHRPKTPPHRPHPPKPVYQPVYQPPVYQPAVTFQGFLPSECQFDIRRGNKKRSVYSKICLGELMVRAETVPLVCEDRVTTSTGRRTQVYDALCLQERGYEDEAGQYN